MTRLQGVNEKRFIVISAVLTGLVFAVGTPLLGWYVGRSVPFSALPWLVAWPLLVLLPGVTRHRVARWFTVGWPIWCGTWTAGCFLGFRVTAGFNDRCDRLFFILAGVATVACGLMITRVRWPEARSSGPVVGRDGSATQDVGQDLRTARC